MKRIPTCLALFLLAAAPASAVRPSAAARSPAGGAASADGARLAPRDPAAAPDFKTPWRLFGAPAEDSPAAQFARARRLEGEERWSAAVSAYDALVHNWGSSPEAPEAQLSVARLLEFTGEYEKAFKEYQYFLEHYGASGGGEFGYADVVAAQFACANQLRTRISGSPWSPSYGLVSAMFRKVADNAPDGPRAAESVYLQAMSLELGGADDRAVPVYERLPVRYPASDLVPSARYRAAFCRARLSDAAPNDERTLVHALQALRSALAAAPGSPDAPRAAERERELHARQTAQAFERAEFYDRVRRRPEAAAMAYRDFLRLHPDAAEAPRARARLAEIEEASPAAAAAAVAAEAAR
ncbi:MAG: tetratricopeptide repeat protein [Kiritimatiellae bacterium]|nr:tetratricopeptide repeat protein [Kiritimatiellia bacterium]